MDWKTRKEWRRREYERRHGVKMIVCAACSGSGYYDNTNSPTCGACDGIGKVFDDRGKLSHPNKPRDLCQ